MAKLSLTSHSKHLVGSLNEAFKLFFQLFDRREIFNSLLVEQIEKDGSDPGGTKVSRTTIGSLLMKVSIPSSVEKWKLGPVSVVSLDHDNVVCPIVESLGGHMLGGIWPLIARLETEIETMEHLDEMLPLVKAIWESTLTDKNVQERKQKVGDPSVGYEGFSVLRQTLAALLKKIITKDPDEKNLLHRQSIMLALCTLMNIDVSP